MDPKPLELTPRVRQETVLAPQLRASLRVLQMDRLALAAEVRHEAEVNPVVEIDDDEDMPTVTEELAAESRLAEPPEAGDVYDESNPPVNRDEDAAERRQQFFDRQVAVESLQEHLMAQVPQADFGDTEVQLAEYLIGDIDDDGRYVGSLDELVELLGVGKDRLERVLSGIQRFDPPGVGGRDLRECLCIQIGDLDVSVAFRDILLRLVREHLELAATGNAQRLAHALGVSVGACENALCILRTLEPKPGRPFQAHGRDAQYISPELVLTADGDACVVRPCVSDLPNLSISPFYQAMLEDAQTPTDTREYLRAHIGSALQLQDAIARRHETVLRIGEAIFEVQRDFIRSGFDALKPLTIQEVARRTGYHGTTVGRAVRGKYVRTPRGVFELKRFFCVGRLEASESDDGVSATAVKRRLATLVGANAGRRMTDEMLTAALSRNGVHISRRTVAKYRAEMGMPAAYGRKGSDYEHA